MYKLYRKPNGQIEQVPINNNDDLFDDLENLDSIEAKGSDPVVAPFLVKEQKQFDLIKENETQQAKFQSLQANQTELQIFNFVIGNFSDNVSANAFKNNYNTTSTTGPVNNVVMFAGELTDEKALFYNVVDCKIGLQYGSNAKLSPDSYVEFYLVERNPDSNSIVGRKIPRIQQVRGAGSGNSVSFTTAGSQNLYQSFTTNVGADVNNIPYIEKGGYRTSGVALKRIDLNFESGENLSEMSLRVQLTVRASTGGTVY